VDDLWATKSEVVGLIVLALSFQAFQLMWSRITIHQRHRETDRRHAIAIPRFALYVHRADFAP